MELRPTPTDFLSRHHSSSAPLAQLVNQVQQAPNWQEKYRALMLGGKALAPLSPEWQTEDARVRGCESAAWLYHHGEQGKHYFIAGSEARIVTGLIALLLGACSGKTSDELAAFDAAAYFSALGLEGQLSPSRTNGVYALANRIKELSREDTP
ncbi:SufE family protein [Shewanella amazonensis]|uniref:Fe-S metabolism associated domain-containing protein n=1 Tax=Shewanella amazonensis (strain ATCC BAA-1098 / SB2B) TaxID=326297 RepID=A1S9C4_SHEAM|nr:SufE family protein [Shewanella amazonensis]ABM00981.1 conserved hypothetical protein [Shewanella amazonensis SB2B]